MQIIDLFANRYDQIEQPNDMISMPLSQSKLKDVSVNKSISDEVELQPLLVRQDLSEGQIVDDCSDYFGLTILGRM